MKPVPLPVPDCSGANGHTTVPRTLTVNRCACPSMYARSGPVCAAAPRVAASWTATETITKHERDMEGTSGLISRRRLLTVQRDRAESTHALRVARVCFVTVAV